MSARDGDGGEGGEGGEAAAAGAEGVAAAAPPPKTGKELSEEEIAEFRELFMMVDSDGGGSIDRMELKQLLDTIGVFPTVEEVNLIFMEVDDSDDGEIQFEEFVQFMSGGIIKGFDPDTVRNAFSIFEGGDEDDKAPPMPPGHLKLDRLKKAFLEHVPDKFQAEGLVDDLLNHLHEDERGLFNYQEFVDLMLMPGGADEAVDADEV